MESKNFNQLENGIERVVSLSEQRNVMMQEIETLRNSKDKVIGIKTGFNQLDTLLSGFQNRNLILLAGRPGTEKTGFILNIINNICKNNYGIMYFSLDLSSTQLIKRFISIGSGVPISTINEGILNDDEWKKVVDTSTELNDKNMLIYENTTISIEELRSKCFQLKKLNKLDLIVVDYLECISIRGERLSGDGMFYNIDNCNDVSYNLKLLSRNLNVPIIVLSDIEERESVGGFRKFDTRELTKFERDSDVVLLMRYDNSNDDFKYIDIIIEKNNNGSRGIIKYKYDNLKSRFYEEQYP